MFFFLFPFRSCIATFDICGMYDSFSYCFVLKPNLALGESPFVKFDYFEQSFVLHVYIIWWKYVIVDLNVTTEAAYFQVLRCERLPLTE